MAALQNLPNETLILILRFLGAIDLQTTLLAQRVSRRFRALIQDTVLHSARNARADAYPEVPSGVFGAEVNPLFRAKFTGLFNSADCFTVAERARYWVLSLDGDATLPFRRLPWVAGPSPDTRDAFLRPEASWRELSPTFGVAPPTRYLDIVKSYEGSDYTRNPVAYFQVELPPSGLTMGLLYDILLCEEALYGRDTGSWQLYVGTGLKSFDVLYRWGCFIIDEPGESMLVSETPDAAILFVRGGECCSRSTVGLNEWTPRRLAKGSRPKFLPWQGPFIDPELTEWFQ